MPVPRHPSKRHFLKFLPFGNGCRCCLSNSHASHTPSIPFSLKVRSPMRTRFGDWYGWFFCAANLYPCRLWSTLHIHGWFHLVRIRNEHSTFSSSSSDDSTLLFDEATSVVESNLHALLHNLVNWDQILCYVRNMQDILNVCLITFILEWDMIDMPNWMCGVVPSLHTPGLIERSQDTEPFFMRCHMGWGAIVDEPYVFQIRGVGWAGGRHRVRFMPHYEHSTIFFKVRVGGVTGELSTCGKRLTFCLSAVPLVVVEHSTIVVFHNIFLSPCFGVKAHPSSESSTGVSDFLSKVWISFMGQTPFARPWLNRPLLVRPHPLPPSHYE